MEFDGLKAEKIGHKKASLTEVKEAYRVSSK